MKTSLLVLGDVKIEYTSLNLNHEVVANKPTYSGQPAANFPRGWTVVTPLGSTNCISLEPSGCGCLAGLWSSNDVVLHV